MTHSANSFRLFNISYEFFQNSLNTQLLENLEKRKNESQCFWIFFFKRKVLVDLTNIFENHMLYIKNMIYKRYLKDI